MLKILSVPNSQNAKRTKRKSQNAQIEKCPKRKMPKLQNNQSATCPKHKIPNQNMPWYAWICLDNWRRKNPSAQSAQSGILKPPNAQRDKCLNALICHFTRLYASTLCAFVSLLFFACLCMPLYAVICRYMPLHAFICLYLPLSAFICLALYAFICLYTPLICLYMPLYGL